MVHHRTWKPLAELRHALTLASPKDDSVTVYSERSTGSPQRAQHRGHPAQPGPGFIVESLPVALPEAKGPSDSAAKLPGIGEPAQYAVGIDGLQGAHGPAESPERPSLHMLPLRSSLRRLQMCASSHECARLEVCHAR